MPTAQTHSLTKPNLIRTISDRTIFIFIAIFFSCFYFSSNSGIQNSADGSQYALTEALANKRTIKINDYMHWTYWTDYSKNESGYYLDREPGLSIISIPFYLIATRISKYGSVPYGGINSVTNKANINQVFTAFTVSLSGALCLAILYILTRGFNLTKSTAFITTITIGTGSLLWKYSTTYYREPVFCLFFLSLWYFLIKGFYLKNKPLLILSGLSFGISLMVDYSKFYLILPIFIYIIWKNWYLFLQNTLLFILGLAIPFNLILSYNIFAFNNPFTNPHLNKAVFPWLNVPQNNFQTPLLKGVAVNLFSSKPISDDMLEFFWSHPDIATQMGVRSATNNIYRGIFIQSPILFLALLGWIMFIKKYLKESFCLFLSVLLVLLITSKISIFWGAANYDTRYFLVIPLVLFIGLAFTLNWYRKIKSTIIKKTGYLFIFGLYYLSLFINWRSVITQIGPNISGEHRFDFSSLLPNSSLDNIFLNSTALFINTFPNFQNLPLLIITYGTLFLLLFIISKFVNMSFSRYKQHYVKAHRT